MGLWPNVREIYQIHNGVFLDFYLKKKKILKFKYKQKMDSSKESNDIEEKDLVKPLAPKLNIPSIICSACDIQGNVTFGKGKTS